MKAELRDLQKMEYGACRELQLSLFNHLLLEKSHINATTHEGEGCVCADGNITPENNREMVGTVLLVEHPPVYTLGKSGHMENLLIDRPTLEKLGATFFHIERGGDITFHGEGQLVCYPILDLEKIGIGLRAYIEALEEAVILTVAHYGIHSGRVEGASGVWIGKGVRYSDGTREEAESPLRKICAIGVRSSRFVTMHGFALNVTTDLGWFQKINPCGFADRGVTSIEKETQQAVSMEEVKRLVVKNLSDKLDVKIYKN